MKKKLDDLTKAKLIYSGELLLFSLIFITLGILFLTGVIAIRDYKKWLFPILTLIGAIWVITEFIWILASPKKRAKSCLIDKILLLPSALTFLGCDTYVLIKMIINPSTTEFSVFFPLYIGITILYLAAVYLFQAIYHFYRPLPILVEAAREDALNEQKEAEEKSESEKEDKQSQEEKKD